jgi:hypothetical protein
MSQIAGLENAIAMNPSLRIISFCWAISISVSQWDRAVNALEQAAKIRSIQHGDQAAGHC